MNKKRLYFLGLITLIGFPLVGITIVGFVEDQPRSFPWSFEQSWYMQLLIGAIIGVIAGFGAWRITLTKFMSDILNRYGKLVKSFKMNTWDSLFMSLCAGIGEEILFRGVIQHYWGIWLTAIFFVAIHGYLNPRDWRISIYGAYMTLVIAGIGYLYEYSGIVAAATAHAAIDFVLFTKMNNHRYQTETIEEKEPIDENEIDTL
ncbi:CPBP family intramembrane glutamic endopeptidase [Salibacter halophilus]|uniref:CPBP family intramembrane metalloprotease n=1 Tax=Salibacter halophilus TaxID=1803916 RepID=A0A6N6M4E8_9FLAO|nr:CPBP family intramembrane glutamic endopeptidase [Salibacter halophilus]KAB1064341.1 CPBP family intramembrane metalloprotease [Salibacter halophilus]